MFCLVTVILSAKAGLHKRRVKIIYLSEFRVNSSCDKDM